MNTIVAGLICAVLLVLPPQVRAEGLELKKGDRIVFLGNTLAERQQYFNHFETQLMLRFPDLDLSVRNLGWSADTIRLQPRPLNFGNAATHLSEQKADVIFAFFGLNESFDGEAGLPQFEADLDAYLKTHLAATYNGHSAPRLVLVSPIAHERLARLVHVNVDARNKELARYTEAMRNVAARNGVTFVDLFTPTKRAMEAAAAAAAGPGAGAAAPLTINGIHLNERGDRSVAGFLMTALGFDAPDASRVAVTGTAAPTDASKTRAVDALRETIREKNQQFFFRFRPVNAEYVVGRRVEPFGSVNFPPEMRELDKRVSDADRRIWKQARALQQRVGRS